MHSSLNYDIIYVTIFPIFAALAILAASGAVQYADEPGQVIVLNPKSYPLVGGYWTVDLDLASGGNLAVAAVDGTYFGDDIGFARMYGQGGADVQPSYRDESTVRFDGIAAGSWHFEVAVYTAGGHDMVFELGGSTARASNNALMPGAFVTTWQTTSAGETIAIPVGNAAGNYTVHWGDGSVTTHTSDATHTYAAAGNHTVRISGDFTRIYLADDSDNAAKLVSIDQWGDVQWKTMNGAFYRASNMIYNATDAPDLSEVTDMSSMFASASSFDGDLSDWDVSGVKGMRVMFWGASSFNGNVSTWDVSRVTDMYSMFNGASKFNGDLSEWDVSRVTDMGSTFARAPVFDSDLSSWDVSRVKSMNGMFKSANAFNSDLSAWDVSSVTDMERLFSFAYDFDGDISAWNVSGVTDMGYMFNHADSFNGNISAWDVSRVTDMDNMFWENAVFNGNLSAWDVSRVTDMKWMFSVTPVFNGNLSAWDVSSVTDMERMFSSANSFNGDISAWDVSSVESMHRMFSNANSFNGDISAWDVSSVESMHRMFSNANSFNGDISAWDVSSVTDMENMFSAAFDFEQNLGNWYIALNNTSINTDDAPGTVGTISAQNRYLDNQNPAYRLVAGGDSNSFEIPDGSSLNMTVSPDKSLYAVNITSTGSFGTSNYRVYNITVPAAPTNPVPAASFGDGDRVDGVSETFDELSSPYYITTVKIGSGTYALVTSHGRLGGVQIIDITDPANPVPAASFDDNDTVMVDGTSRAFDELQGPKGIATTTIGTNTYALVAAYLDDGVQIIDITDPANPVPAASFGNNDTVTVNGADKTFDKLDGAFGMATATIGSGTYALVTAYFGHGVQIINITDPANPVPAASFGNNDTVTVDGISKTFDKLKGGEGIATATIGSGTYALVAAYHSDGVQIIDITDPANPVPTASFGDGDRVDGVSKAFDELKGVNGITTATIGTNTYALVAAYDDDGVQIINITDPANPVPAASFDNGTTVAGKTFDKLDGASAIATATIGPGTYALVAAVHGNGVQIIDITDPANPVPAASVGQGDSFDGKTFDELVTPRGITTATIDTNAYALVAAYDDDGVQIIDLGETPDTTAPPPDGSFVTTWQTTSAGETITIPVNNAMGIYTVHWGDGSATAHASDANHTYAAAGSYTVSISGDFTRIYLADDSDNAAKLVSIDQWGDVRWESMSGAFYGASNMIYNTTDAPDLSGVTDMSRMFGSASSLDGDLSVWDVSDVTDMSGMFNGASSFDGGLSAWDVSGVVDMTDMLSGALTFDGNLSAWNVSNVESMGGMFRGAPSFNGNISTWDVSGVVDMTDMLSGALTFDGNLSAWNVSNVEYMRGMFFGASAFDGNLSAWDVSNVTDMGGMFNGASSFDGDLSAWDVSSVTDMGGMFNGASAFRQNLGNWYVALDSTVIHADDAPGTVGTISAQNRYLDNQNPAYRLVAGGDSDSFEIPDGSSLSMTVPPDKSLYTVTITSTGSFGTSNYRVYNITATNLNTAFSQSPDGPFATTWKTTSAGETITIPVGNAAGNYTVHWGDGSVTTHRSGATHAYAAAGNHTVRISGDFTRIYLADDSDNAAKLVSIDQWGDVRWKSMNGAFRGASNMTYSATDVPDLSRVLDASSMFRNAASFDGDLSAWDVSGVTNTGSMFRGAASFDSDLSEWDVSGVTNMHSMFRGAASFDSDLSEWDVSGVTNMHNMFRGAASFDSDLSAWNVSDVTYMYNMFRGAASFDSDLSEWDVSSIIIMDSMFTDASAFRQNLGNWYIVLDNMTIDYDDAPGIVGSISAQNSFLDGQNPVYGIGSGGDFDSFELNGSSLVLKAVPAKRTYAVNVTSTGDFGTGNSKMIEITVSGFNTLPTVDAGEDQTVREGHTVTLSGTAADADDNTLTYSWTHDSSLVITVSNGDTLTPSFTAPQVTSDTTIAFTLGVFDGNHAVTDSVSVTISDNSAPTVSAGSNQTVQEGATVTLSGTATDGDGDPLTYSWTHDSSLAVQLANSTSPSTTFTAPAVDVDTEITFTLTADDGTATATDSLAVTVTDVSAVNRPPVIDAGSDQIVEEGASVILTATATDADDDQMTYLWSQTAGSPTVALTGADTLSPVFAAPPVPSDTEFAFELAVNDGSNNSTDTVKITVRNVPDSSHFVTTWQTTAAGESITIPVGGASGTYTVDWGDGNTSVNVTGDQTHTYDDAGTYTVRISGDFTRIHLNGQQPNADKLQSIERWGDTRWESMGSAFRGASNVVYNATDIPVLSDVTTIRYMFYGAASVDGDLSGWDVSRITDMFGTFWGAESFSGDLSGWDVSSVTDMKRMLSGATSFNADISDWDVSRVTDMSGMFYGAESFNADLSNWNVSRVTDMSSMFLDAESFDADLSGWNVSRVTTMFATFMGAESFDADISNWNVSGVTNMHATFRNADSFNRDISNWNVSGVTSMSDMFMDAASFNADISNWNVSGVTNMHTTFRNADSFNRDISAWNVSGVTNMNGMFYLADAFEQNLGNWYVALDSTVIHADDAPGTVGTISAQNQYLDNQNPAYRLVAGGDSDSFEIPDGSSLNMTVSPTKSLYAVNITSTGSFGTSNYRVYNITVTPSSTNSQSSDGPFATTWKTTSAGETITIPVGNAAGNYTVRWGDGSVTTHRSGATHAYAAAGNHTVLISGDFTRIYLAGDSDNAAKLVSIDQWGDVRWESMNGAFRGASNMIYNATDVPDLSRVWDTSSMFRSAASFDGDLSAWDVSGVTNMHSMFRGAASFDGDLSAWDVSDVTYMYNMFRGAASFDGDLSAWDVSGVTSMSSMFRDATFFDGDLSAWNVSDVTDMYGMFYAAASFDSDLSEWDVSSITTMGNMFTDASAFRQNLGNWYVALDSTVIHADDAPGTVGTISAQNQYLDNQNPAYRLVAGGDSDSFEIPGGSSLDMTVPPDKSLYTVNITSTGSFGTSNYRVYNITATNLNTAFSQSPDGPFATTWKTTSAGETITIPVGNAAGNYTVHWGDGSVTTHRSGATHAYAAAGNHTVRISGDFTRIYLADDSDNAAKLVSIDQWGDVRWESMNGAFYGASNMTYSATDAPNLSRVTDMSFMFGSASPFDGNLSAWDVSSVTDMTGMFAGASAFDSNLSAWDVSSVTDMTGMFNRASSFDGNLSGWDVSSVESMNRMFSGASKFNGNLSGWDVSSVESMGGMFGGASKFNGNLSGWNVSSVESMGGMFGGASKFNGNLSGWDVSSVESMGGMFGGASKFNGNLSGWDVSSVESMGGMFGGASKFNGNLSGWNVSSVESMNGMFSGALAFGGNLSAWDVSSVTDMGGMFLDAAAFNGDLSSWDVSNVKSMNGMFWRASAFDGNLSSWGVSNVEYMRGMFFGASAFDGNLSDWDVSSVVDMDSMFTGASAFRQNLGNWHVVLDDTVISNATETLAIRAQNSWLDSRNPTYGLGTGGDSDLFVITGGTLGRNSAADYSDKTGYSVNITSTGDFGTGNHRVYDITVTDEDTIPDTAPTVTSIERDDPASQTTDSQMLVFKVTFSEDVTGVDQADFVLSSGGTGTGSVTNLAGSGSQYLVNVSAAQDGTYNLDLVSSGHGITDAADNPLADPNPTGADHTYAVDTTAPTVTSIVRSDPAEATTSERTLVFAITFSEDVTGVDQADFVLSSGGTGTGSVTNLAGSGSQYLVNVSAAQDGTYNLDLVPSGHGITDAADNPLADPNPTGADHTYAVDTTAPTVTSIVRSDPAEATTSERTLVFAVTFSEDVTGVDLSDFALSPDSAGGGSAPGRFAQTSAPAAPITDHNTMQDTITVGPSGTATSVSVAVDITHTFIGDLVIDLIAPDDTAQTLHSRTGGSANDIGRTYTPNFDGTGITGNWTLRVSDRAGGDTGTLNGWTLTIDHGGTGTGSVTNLAGSGSQYLVNVSAAQDGTYNLDLVPSGHGITDAADNPLSSPTPTGADHTYTVGTIPADTTAPTVTSIVRSDPAEATTSERTLVFAITFSEDVTGVDQADFVLSSGGTGTGSVTNLAGSGSQYLVNVSAAQHGTYNLDIVPNSGITDMAGNPLADGDTLVDQSFHVPSPAVVPELTTMPDRIVNELSVLTFVAGVTNGDLLVGPLTYGLDGGPAGAAMDPATGSFEWTPAETQNGGHTVTVTVSDSNGLTDSQDVAVTVNEVNANPVLDEIPDQTVDTSSTLTFVASATDDDRYPGVGVETVAANLQIPWSIDWIPDGAALFTERGGNLRIIRDGVLASDPLLSLSVSSGEGGLLGVAVDPDFGDNHYIYLYYSTRGTDNALINKVVRYQFANGTVTEDRVLVDGIPGAQYHDGGRIQFGPDGKLYITTGDAGRLTLAQDLDSLAGKILRIDRNGAVPADNPFVNSSVWSFGHRNPQGLDWDAAGNLVATEHGPSGERGRAHDEINLILPGANYGWPNVIGGEFEEGMREPILHTGSDTWAPSGAEFYDGDRIPGWTGKYFVAALRGAHLHMVDLDLRNNAVISNEKLFQDEFGRLRDVQTGPDGFLYLLTSNRDGRGSPVSTDDRILRIVPVSDADRSRPANTLTYGLDDGPEGASIDPVTGTFVWTPAGNRETGTVTFNVTVSDGRGGTDMQTVRVHVNGTITPQVLQTPRDIGGITLTSTGPGVIEASWEAPTETPADYRIAWAKVGEPYLTWTDLSGNAFPTSPSQTVTDLEEGEQYKVKVRARYSSGGPGDWSGELTVTVAGTG